MSAAEDDTLCERCNTWFDGRQAPEDNPNLCPECYQQAKVTEKELVRESRD